MGKVAWVLVGTTVGAIAGFWYQNKLLADFRESQAQQKELRQQEMAKAASSIAPAQNRKSQGAAGGGA